ncbi:DUF397 domain-containing protein [Streptomyces albidus (ex Kaewkla and Franco 2022)]|uniref:DUF397 domain-containing protein n=1 Tax=Streptomyces albidus (ex Kaewkla and Franco 2022) TaxID=722709 RepID=UPI002815F6F4|nr:DUF397 domain-containing protein [Streptomyces albidus (ex Kaewkla and Franco 2022)]
MSIDEVATATTDLAWLKSSHSGPEGGDCVEVAVEWRKSSYSGPEGGQCVEVAAQWRKSSYSDGEGGQCVEVADCPGVVHVRDSKDTSGPVLSVGPGAWAAFLGFAGRQSDASRLTRSDLAPLARPS